MGINWGSLGLVAVVALAITVAVVVLVAFAIIGLSAREHATSGTAATGVGAALSPIAGTAVAGICLLAAAAIVLYGLYVIIA